MSTHRRPSRAKRAAGQRKEPLLTEIDVNACEVRPPPAVHDCHGRRSRRTTRRCRSSVTKKHRRCSRRKSSINIRHVARVSERGVTFCGGLGELPQKILKFKVANTSKFNDFLQLPKIFRMSKNLLLMTEMPDLLQAAFPETVFNALNI